MEFNNLKCPVCDERFKDGDDIVVCPECGAPHHRACYEIENHCAFEDKHGEDFDFKSYSSENPDTEEFDADDVVICPRCKTENEKGSFYCKSCGFPVGFQDNRSNPYNNTNNQPFNNTSNPFAAAFDPMAGVNPNEDMGDGVTAGDISKFVKNNTPYFIRVFKNIKDFNKGKFSFCAFIFSGGYLLYRKMYKLGTLFTFLSVMLVIAETYILNFAISDQAKSILYPTNGSYSYTKIFNSVQTLSFNDQLMIMISGLCVMLTLAIKILVGIYANRWYFKHCKQKISAIKKEPEDPQPFIEKVGGVNTALAMSMLAVVVVLEFLPIPISIFI